jgi:hypothetical protein
MRKAGAGKPDVTVETRAELADEVVAALDRVSNDRHVG